MVFCGQCGLQLAPGATRCPRCGAAIEPGSDLGLVAEELYTDDPTAESISYATQNPPAAQRSAAPFTPSDPQKLVLRPDGRAYDYGTQEANEATSMLDAPTYDERISRWPSNANTRVPNASYPGYAPQASYPVSQSDSNYPSQEAAYPAFTSPAGASYQSASGQYYPGRIPAAQTAKGRVAALVIVLLGLLLILGAMVLFTIQHNGGLLGIGGRGGNAITPTTPPSPQAQAQALIQRYYDDVNQQNYQDAYSLRSDSQGQSLAAFAQGYAHTKHDDVTFDDVVLQSDGTVKVSVTIKATEDKLSGKGTKHSNYKGYYIVGQQPDGTWKILGGKLGLA